MTNPFTYLYRRLLRTQMQGYDPVLLTAALLLCLVGVVMIFTASTPLSDRIYGNSLTMLRSHLMHLALALFLLWSAMRLDYGKWQNWVPYALLVCFLLLVMVLIPGLGRQVGGARRWLNLGLAQFQPTEVLKVVLIAHMASYLDRKPEAVMRLVRGLGPTLAVMGVFLALVLMQPDFGTMVLIAMTLLMMVFVGGARPGQILFSLAGLMVIGVILIFSQSYRMKRILAFLDPWQDRFDSGFQIIQSYLAFGQGGWTGVGLGDSRQKMFFLPDAHTDFIFSILAEEWGLVGVLAVMGLFAVFLWRGFQISLHCKDDFGKHLAGGITILISMQVIINMAVVMGLLPTKGLPLPFISYGGSSLVVTGFMTGILLNIGRRGVTTGGQGPRH